MAKKQFNLKSVLFCKSFRALDKHWSIQLQVDPWNKFAGIRPNNVQILKILTLIK